MEWIPRWRAAGMGMAAVIACGVGCGVVTAQEAKPADAPVVVEPATPLYKAEPGRWGVKTIDESWVDEARKRTIQVRAYLPQEKDEVGGDEKRPVVIFSHGLGGSGLNYAYFGNHLASHGYIVIAPTHPGSDTDQAREWIRTNGSLLGGGPGKDEKADEPEAGRPIEKIRERIKERREGEKGEQGPEPGAGMMPGMTGRGGWMMTTVDDPENLRNRPKDISFVIDRLATHELLGPIVDMKRIGVAGHSFGAFTAMAVGGMTVDLPETQGGKGQSFRDERVKAVLPMSPEGAGTMGIVAGAWEKFAAPALFLTGTKDYGSGPRSAAWRRQGFDGARDVERYLVTLEGAGHMTFANPGERSVQDAAKRLGVGLLLIGQHDGKKQARHIELVESISMMFFDAYLRQNEKAMKELREFCAGKRNDSTREFAPRLKTEP